MNMEFDMYTDTKYCCWNSTRKHVHNCFSDRQIFQMTEWKIRVTEFPNSHYRQAQIIKNSDKSI